MIASKIVFDGYSVKTSPITEKLHAHADAKAAKKN